MAAPFEAQHGRHRRDWYGRVGRWGGAGHHHGVFPREEETIQETAKEMAGTNAGYEWRQWEGARNGRHGHGHGHGTGASSDRGGREGRRSCNGDAGEGEYAYAHVRTPAEFFEDGCGREE